MVEKMSNGTAESSAEGSVVSKEGSKNAVRSMTIGTISTPDATSGREKKTTNDADNATKTPLAQPMTGERTREAAIGDPDDEVKAIVGETRSKGDAKKTTKQSKQPGLQHGERATTKGAAAASTSPSKRRTPMKIEPMAADGSESSSAHDYFETFRGFLRGEKNVEKVRKRLASPKSQENATPKAADSLKSPQPKPRNGSSAGTNGTTAEPPVPMTKDAQTTPQRPPPTPQQKRTTTTTTPSSTAAVFLTMLRSLLIDFPLVVLFATFVGVWIIKGVHQDFFDPLFRRAQRVDQDLLDEFTYYERQCTGFDLTTRDMQNMIVPYNSTDINGAVDIMMTHGLSIIPQVLRPETVRNLREYIVYRNANIPKEEEYPMSQGHKRISYGIEAAEHPAVTAALQEVARHPILRPLLAALLGDDDPASSEITAITNYPGARRQVWHQDTKQDGNAIKFARTYSHSYSLFLPLQDITEGMGATDVCPGTHYCTNDLTKLCSRARVALNEVTEHKILPAGAGALLNQHLWHRGGAHKDPNAPDRIVFIVSFLARPNFGVDPRQLSRGTYFHQKWNMWGHTWNDLLDPAKRMRFPFSILRCLSIWKPTDSNWGYDLITSGFMRFANGQLEDEDFYNRFLPKLDEFHFPSFLRGRQVAGSQLKLWSVFIRTTIEKVHKFFAIVVLVTYLLYLGVGAGYNMYAGSPPKRWVPKALIRLILVNALIAVIGARVWFNIRNSAWGQHVSSGRALMRPFPPRETYSFAERSLVPKGPTTMPTRWDVLIGTRFSADFLGSYRRWLDFHPGNVHFRHAIDDVASSFRYFASLEPRVQSRIVLWIMNEIRKSDGRVLHQDYTTGDWRVASETETFEEVAKALAIATSPLLNGLASKLDVMIDDRCFGPTRGSAIGSLTHLLLFDIRRALLYRLPPKLLSHQKTTTPWRALPRSSVQLRTVLVPPVLSYSERSQAHSPFAAENPDELQVGSLVWANLGEGGWQPGSVLGFSPAKDWVFFGGDDSEMDGYVSYKDMRKFRPPTEGGRIMGCYEEGLNDCFPGTTTRVHPGGSISIYFDDGEAESLMSPSSYYQPPFRYEGPFPV